MSDRSFGNDIGNTTTMTSSTADDITDVSLAKNEKLVGSKEQQMEKAQNGSVTSRLPRPLAIEVYTKVHNSTLSKDGLWDELDDIVDEKYYEGEVLLSSGKEFVVVSSEKRGGLTTYTMDDGSKIGHRDLKRKKGLSVDEIKQIATEDADFIDGKWVVREDLLKEYPIRETIKYASIFCAKPAKKQAPPTSEGEESGKDGEDEGEGGERNGGRNPRRSTRGVPAGNMKAQDKQRQKEAKEKEKAEKKEKEKEEKRKKKEEEKAQKEAEKEKKKEEKARKNGTLDKFVKKSSGSPINSKNGTAAFFSPSKWAERRVGAGVKKMEEAWKKRDQEAYQEACGWCEKNLSGPQQKSIENPIWRFSVQKLVDKTKDKAQMKMLKNDKKAEFKAEMAEKRKAQYQEFEPKIRAWFSEAIAQDDLLLTGDRLELVDAQKIDCDEEMLKCMEITQFFVSMRKILIWNENVSAQQLHADLYDGVQGFRRTTYPMIANLLETALQEKEHEKAAHCNARLSEFPITENTISELVRAFFVGKTEMSWKEKAKNGGQGQEMEEMDYSEEKEEKEEDDEKEEEKIDKEEDKEPEDDKDDDKEEQDDEEERDRLRILGLFSDSCHIYEWPAGKQLEVLYAMKQVVHGLPIIREWFLKDANSDQLMALKVEAGKIGKKIEKYTSELSDLPQIEESTEEMSRTRSRELEKIVRQRRGLEQLLDELKDELEENREQAARERDNLERIFRVVSIGSDRHLRKYYWFAYSCDAGIWVQDLGTTAYETWVRQCADKSAIDVETGDDLPDYTDLPVPTPSNGIETWYKLSTEDAIRKLENALKKNGRREKMLKKYLANNMEDILASIKKPKTKKKGEDEQEEEQDVDSRASTPVDSADESQEGDNGADKADTDNGAISRFTGPFGSLKTTMSELLIDWQQSGITKIADLPLFETRMDDAQLLDEMKVLVTELVSSVPKEVLIEKFPQNIAIAKKCFSHLKIDRFLRRIKEATNSSCLHMLLAYFDARIDSKRTLPELPCSVCRSKRGTQRKLMCKQCTTVYHHSCLRPAISREQFEEDGFKESWWCAKCRKEERRRQLEEQKAAAAKDEEDMDQGSGGEQSSDEEDAFEEENPRSRNAKRKANVAMRDVLEFEGVLRKEPHQAPPPPKRAKKEPLPEVRELFDSIEKANPRLYKVLQQVPTQSRATRTSNHEVQSLVDIEDNLDVYTSAEQLKELLHAFFHSARGYIETHNSRKLDEFDSLISELNFI